MLPKEIVVLSGKGGAGKTTVTSILSYLLPDKVICDCDVEGANLHLLLHPEILWSRRLSLGRIANVRQEICVGCGECARHCRFSAIRMKGQKAEVMGEKCEGCGVCDLVCPVGAIEMVQEETGWIYRGKSEWGEFFYAELEPGKGNSGRLVSELKQQARSYAVSAGVRFMLVDGPPGLGCPVISALTGAEIVALVQEATPSGYADMERLIMLTERFPNIKLRVGIINKWGIDESADRDCEGLFVRHNIPIIAKIEFDEKIVQSQLEGKIWVPEYLNKDWLISSLGLD